MNKPTREEVLTLADTVALCGATRLAEVLRRSVKLEDENERLREMLLDIRKDALTSHWHRDIDDALRQEV